MRKLSSALLAKTIQEARKQKGITQAQLADITGIHRTM
ncbi:MAG: helix-turn-helix transcriptional regulator, partial [Lachnospiraceae bacterium]|nr:helix-turn-helix transcriptional regulator [Lachnospiraceae bacterium]